MTKRWRIAAALTVIAAVAVLVVAIAGDDSDSPGGRAGSTTTSTMVPVELLRSPGATKDPIVGLIDRKGLPAGANADLIDGAVVNVTWAELQPAAGALDLDVLDVALGAAQVAGVEAKLRIDVGLGAPRWLLDDIGSTRISHRESAGSAELPRFWTDGYAAAHTELHRLLAAEYDDVDVLAEVVVSGCMIVYAEPMLRGIADDPSRAAMVADGFDARSDRACQEASIDAAAAWELTAISLALNPYQRIGRTGAFQVDVDTSLDLARRCRAAAVNACVVANNSIRTPPIPSYAEMYTGMAALGAPLSFQTAAPERIGDEAKTLRWAIEQGAASVELNRDYDLYDRDLLREIRDGLGANR